MVTDEQKKAREHDWILPPELPQLWIGSQALGVPQVITDRIGGGLVVDVVLRLAGNGALEIISLHAGKKTIQHALPVLQRRRKLHGCPVCAKPRLVLYWRYKRWACSQCQSVDSYWLPGRIHPPLNEIREKVRAYERL